MCGPQLGEDREHAIQPLPTLSIRVEVLSAAVQKRTGHLYVRVGEGVHQLLEHAKDLLAAQQCELCELAEVEG